MSNHSGAADAAFRASPAGPAHPTASSSRWTPFAIFLAIAVAIACIGIQWIKRHKALARQDAQVSLQAVTQLKATQVESWRAGVEHAAQMLARDPRIEEALAAPSVQRTSAALARDHIDRLLDSHRRETGITGLTLLDSRGNVLLSTGTQALAQEQRLRALALDGMRSGRLLWDDIHTVASLRDVAISVVVPVSAAKRASLPASHALILHVDPARFLFPFIQHWPTSSGTAETFLFRREGDQVVYLNTPRHRNVHPLSLRFSASDERLLAAQALRGERGALEGRDYRGAHVVGYALRIAGSPWFLIAKIDARELYAPIERTAGAIAFAAGAALVACALAVHLWWRRRADAHIRLYGAVFETTREAVIITDADQRIVATNPAFSEITGYPACEVIGQTPRLLSSGRQDASFYQRMWSSLSATGNWAGEIWNRRKDGSVYPQWQSVSEIRDRRGYLTHYVAIFSDISERKSAEARISFLAYHDALTGLPNRTLLRDRMSQALSAAQRSNHRVAIMLIDLDRFKNINDTLGHSAGDELLRGVASRLQTVIRSNDTVCRIGGDEFVILLPTINAEEEAAVVAQRVIAALAEPLVVNSHEIHVTLSIGVCTYPGDAVDVDSLLRCADTAMYQAKEQGRNGYRFFTPEMNARVVERLAMETELRTALARGEFRLHYQAQVSLASERVIGVEALLRWQSSTGVTVLPSRFIPVAEECGLITPIGVWVLHEACRQRLAWDRQGWQDFPVSVNVSPLQLRDGSFDATVAHILEETGLPPQLLELELTESAIMNNGEDAVGMLQRLKALGVRLSIDDFGTGYSSLSYLKRFPIDRLKIDRSFIRDLMTDPNDVAIVKAILALGHSLNLDVIAEGVEDAEQLARLRALGCDEVQGYLIGKPMPAEELVANRGLDVTCRPVLAATARRSLPLLATG